MIVAGISLLGLVVWTFLLWVGLKRLRVERMAQEKRPWVGDHFRLVRNKRAVAMFTTWSMIFAFTLSSVSFIDVGTVEFSRLVRGTESIVIVVCGLWIWLGPGDKVT